MPDSRTGALSRDAVRGLTSSWWLGLILGVLELLLGIWAAGYPGRSLFVFVNLVGVYAIFYGFTELFAAFDLRGLGHRLERPAPGV